MNTLFQFLAGGAFGLFAVGLFWLAVELDNAELQAGKSPHSGFTPDCPIPFDGLEKPSRSTRIVESNNQ
ncbi:hypothetical protein SI90_08830 [Akkermansia muciniphila]|uniref:hypothetical protein n=1 Tax=Akkermansia muciniphila TaxID=239935 RepID=UPI000FF8FE16|nr:hypothetical protein [Akkermansia muciniphila]MCO6190138.1 hypothetical protein [Akkermansia muciniphila]QAR50533.1 hypothetical protein SI90_08830 [Akkermansia muciniphila]